MSGAGGPASRPSARALGSQRRIAGTRYPGHPEGGIGVRSAVSDTERNDLRVILVGRTGLDAALRLDPGIELVRVQTPLEAVGELASPVDSLSPSRAVVVLAPEVETSLRRPDANEGIQDFVGGLRIADPAVVVMGVTRNRVRPGCSRAPGPWTPRSPLSFLPMACVWRSVSRQGSKKNFTSKNWMRSPHLPPTSGARRRQRQRARRRPMTWATCPWSRSWSRGRNC